VDRLRARAGALSAVLFAFLLAAAADSPRVPIREARWLASGSLPRALLWEPPECLVQPRDPAERWAVAIGRVAFRAPLLLGGQAARAGMSCATCHRNGRGNPDFLFPGLSGGPGTADVTSSLMSSHRGDHVVNPKPIPDLGGSRATLKVSRDAGDPALERFIRGLVVEEFDGPEPSPEVLSGLVAYVRALRPEACRGSQRRVGLGGRLADVDTAVALAKTSSGETRRLLLAAARSTLGAVDERFRAPDLENDRRLLRQSDAILGGLRAGSNDFGAWRRTWPPVRAQLLRDEPRSLYDPARLGRALAGSKPQT
jgi:mono/diheme cytochrome c family protein